MSDVDVTRDDAFLDFLPGKKLEDDSRLIPEFFLDKKLLGHQSNAEGRPIYVDQEYCRIRIKGQPHAVVVEEVNRQHRERFPIAYARFLQNKPQEIVGTPIEHLPNIGPSQAEMLKLLNIRSIEDLAAITDEAAVQRIGMGARALIQRAKAYLERTNLSNLELQQENKSLREKLEALSERLAAVEQRPGESTSSPRRAKKGMRGKRHVPADDSAHDR